MPLSLPTVSVPFPVQSSYVIRADLARMPENTEPRSSKHFHIDAAYFDYVQEKLQQLQTHPELCHVYSKADQTALITIAWRIFAKLSEEYPEYAVTKNGVRLELLGLHLDNSLELQALPHCAKDVFEYLSKQHGLKRLIDTLALALQDDLVILHNTEPDRTELMHVCFPSHWNPAERVGQGLYGLHQPVANNQQLLKASRNVAEAMSTKGPFVRFVWSLNSTDELNLNPALHTQGRKKPLGNDPSQWFFRVERQTTLAFPDLQRSLFTIRIYIEPLTQTLQTPERKHLLSQAICSMDETLLRYKGLVKVKDVLLEYLK
jgi:Protein of unknown function (DUF3445)